MVKIFYVSLASLFFSHSLIAQENSIDWIVRHYPPYFIMQGEFKGQGYGDVGLEIITEYLPNYIHRKREMTIDRLMREAAKLKSLCGQSIRRTLEREEVLYYSIPADINLPHLIYIRKNDLLKFQHVMLNGKISLELLLKNKPQLVLGIESSRSYGLEKDLLLEKYKKAGNKIYSLPSTNTESLIRMLEIGRVDYIIEYPRNVSYTYINNQNGLRSLLGFGVIEGSLITLSHFVCAKTKTGRKVIDKINQALKKELPNKRYRVRAERWLDSGSISIYREAYEELLLKGLNKGNPNQ